MRARPQRTPRVRVHIDIETYCELDLRHVGVYRYTEHPSFMILVAAWSTDGETVRVAVGEDKIHAKLDGYLNDPSAIKVAHNAQFERVCFSRFVGLPVDEYLDPTEWHDTMAVAGELGYPQSLLNVGQALGGEQKDEAGTALVSLFCKPNRKGKRVMPEDRPDKWADFVGYCAQDVVTLIDVDRKLGPFPTETEAAVYVADQRINDHGVVIDHALARKAVTAAEANRVLQEIEVYQLTGVTNPGSVPQMLAWANASGLGISNLQKATVDALLERDTLTLDQRRVLELRQELALAASSKFTAALNGMCSDGRFRGGFKFFGAHTGRWSGRGLQLQNLPRVGLASEVETDAAILDLLLDNGAESSVLKQLVRPLLIGPYTVVDYSAIEARVIAWLAHETWALDAFVMGRDIYVESAKRMGPQYTRAHGKVATLALGFGGGVNSLRKMGAEGTDAELQPIVDQWRSANPRIRLLWNSLGNAVGEPGRVGKHLRVSSNGSRVHLHLPSGRAIAYHGMKWERYSALDPRTGKRVTKEGWRYTDPKGGPRIGTYGGRLAENATQAVARDLLAEALVRLHERGYPVAGHVHDEFLIPGKHDVDEIAAIVSEPPAWAKGLPVNAEGFVCARYRKG